MKDASWAPRTSGTTRGAGSYPCRRSATLNSAVTRFIAIGRMSTSPAVPSCLAAPWTSSSTPMAGVSAPVTCARRKPARQPAQGRQRMSSCRRVGRRFGAMSTASTITGTRKAKSPVGCHLKCLRLPSRRKALCQKGGPSNSILRTTSTTIGTQRPRPPPGNGQRFPRRMRRRQPVRKRNPPRMRRSPRPSQTPTAQCSASSASRARSRSGRVSLAGSLPWRTWVRI
mmetsp:Transcript_45879/g.137081  ORF Transcript_45879/g.137081 Transcript_45879/m.137081 type:complete len:227 (+) Transcript_45879:144-824(+)